MSSKKPSSKSQKITSKGRSATNAQPAMAKARSKSRTNASPRKASSNSKRKSVKAAKVTKPHGVQRNRSSYSTTISLPKSTNLRVSVEDFPTFSSATLILKKRGERSTKQSVLLWKQS